MNIKSSKGASKEIIKSFNVTEGLPKGSNPYGSRASHSTRPSIALFMLGCGLSNVKRRGRAAGFLYFQVRSYCSVENISVMERLDKIANEAKTHPEGMIDRNIYNCLLDKAMLMRAYNNLKSKKGSMTPGLNPSTLDRFSEVIINELIDDLRTEKFQFKPARRMYIPKSNGGKRPLTIASPKDKIILEAMRIILDIIFDPIFEENSHGFRNYRGCHTALKMVEERFKSAK